MLLAAVAASSLAHAADPGVRAELSRVLGEGRRASGAAGKIDERLRAALAGRGSARGAGAARFDAADRVQVYVRAAGSVDALAATLVAVGATVEHRNPRAGLVQARVPASRLAELAALADVESLAPPSYATVRAGSVSTAGDGVLRAEELRALGASGAGARVGVISDGANARAAAIASGDLPDDVTVLSECDPAVSQSTCNEGTAMLEIVHDLAPDARLAFCSGLTTLAFVDCVAELRERFGANVIVDDLGFFGEPYFEDGAVATAVREAVAAGVVYVSAAGNEALDHYEAEFVGATDHFVDDAGVPLAEQDFGASLGGASDTTLDVTVPAGGTFNAFLEWNDPFGGSANDYDLVLLNADEDRILFASQARQTGRSDPFEALAFTNPLGRALTVKLAVVRFAGEARRLELFLSGDLASHEHNVADGSVVGHPAVAGVLAAGAIAAGDPGNDDIESFSSRGPSLIYFPAQDSRPKPDVVAVDGVAVTGAGGFPTPFYGTSAAAPHVAGVAALVIGGLHTPSEVGAALRASSVDLGDTGFDATYGFGRVDALAAATRLNVPPNAVIETPASDVTVEVGSAVSFAGSCNDPEGLDGLAFQWDFGDPAIAPSTAANPGNVRFDHVGAFVVRLLCSDGLGAADPSPATREVTVAAPRARHGGGCAIASEPRESRAAAACTFAGAALLLAIGPRRRMARR
ncbi:MAG: S8 family serine peptidase [bacterium]